MQFIYLFFSVIYIYSLNERYALKIWQYGADHENQVCIAGGHTIYTVLFIVQAICLENLAKLWRRPGKSGLYWQPYYLYATSLEIKTLENKTLTQENRVLRAICLENLAPTHEIMFLLYSFNYLLYKK